VQQKDANPRHRHLLIAGAGRSGTSLLVRILDACGLETELRNGSETNWNETANAGLGTVPIRGPATYVVKSPWAYQFIDQFLDRDDVTLDAVIIPMRSLAEATASRVILELRSDYAGSAAEFDQTWRDQGRVSGGVVFSLEPLDQARGLGVALYKLIERLVARDVPIIFLDFPRFARDLTYLRKSLVALLPEGLSEAAFVERVSAVIDLGKIRISDELSGINNINQTLDLPSFKDLDLIALKREFLRVRAERDSLNDQLRALRSPSGHESDRGILGHELVEPTPYQSESAARAELEAIRSSTTWKATAPLRAIITRLRRRG